MNADDLISDDSFLPDVTFRWLGRITDVAAKTLTISITPREDRNGTPALREFDRHFSVEGGSHASA